jgi:hypothetical protein
MIKQDKIFKLIKAIGNEEACNIYFDWNNYLIKQLDISSDDKRISINARYDSRIRFSTNLNTRLVLGLSFDEKGPIWMLMVYEKDLKHFKKNIGLEYFKEEDNQVVLAFFNYNQFKAQQATIKEAWIKCCKEYLPQSNGSLYRKSNIPLLYEMSIDPEIRKEILENAKSNEVNKNFMKAEKGTTKQKSADQIPFNLILYGPPGTGKTYELRDKYFKMFTDEQVKQTREEYNLSLVKDLAWWEVISVVMLDLKKAKVIQIFEHPLLSAKNETSTNKSPRNTIWAWLQRHTKIDCKNVNSAIRDEPLYFWKDENSEWSIDQEIAKKESPELFEVLENYKNFMPKIVEEKRYVFTTFHQSYSYEDFVEGIKPVMNEEEKAINNQVRYEITPGIFKLIVKDALNNPSKKYALFIDEINRGNIANIFGELITLIETDKRLGNDQELVAKLPYSKETFGVPSNLYIIGTMNTADRSVEALDTALRRRFCFEEMPPLYDLQELSRNINGNKLSDLLKKINQRIEKLLSKDQLI